MSYFALVLQLVTTSDSEDVLRQNAAHSSGYVREAVMRRCAELELVALLPEVAARLNDWVPPVRQAARSALSALLPAASLAALLPLLPRILREGRADSAQWLAGFEQALIRKMPPDDLCAAAREADIKVARAVVTLLDRHRLLAPEALVALILERHDDIVLARRAVELCARLPPEARGAGYRAALRSHFGAVRTLALRALLAMPDEACSGIAVSALEDVQSSVRQSAIAYLSTTGCDVRAYYRDVLAKEATKVSRTRICLSTLAGLRDKADLPLIQSFQSSGHPVLRVTALSLWFKLAEQDKDRIALEAMRDPSSRPRKFAVQLVHRHGAYIPFPAIVEQLAVSEDLPSVLRLAEGNKWHWLECVARIGMRHGVAEARRLGLDIALAQWLRSPQWYERPGKEQLRFLSSPPVLEVLAGLLPAQQLALLKGRLQL